MNFLIKISIRACLDTIKKPQKIFLVELVFRMSSTQAPSKALRAKDFVTSPVRRLRIGGGCTRCRSQVVTRIFSNSSSAKGQRNGQSD